MPDEEQYPLNVDPEEATEELTPKEDLSQAIPGFHLLQKLGDDGMGEDFEAELTPNPLFAWSRTKGIFYPSIIDISFVKLDIVKHKS